MKITKARLKEIIKEELDNLEEYSPYQKGARPDKRHKKPGEIKDDGKYADPKRARPTREELEGTDTLSEGAREMEMLMSAVEAMAASRGPEVVANLLREIADGLGQGKVSINEELTRQDKTDVKKMVQDELGKLLKKKDTKDQMGEIVKKIMKKLYKDLSLEHPYIIDRIKI